MAYEQGQTYTPDQFAQWYRGQFGGADPTQDQWNQIGSAVGAPGANGQYSQAQWDSGQQAARGLQGAQGQQGFFPEFNAPTYEQGPAYQAPAPFQAPTMEQAMADPGYQMSLQQGLGALQNSQAAAGLARTGGALKGLIDYGNQAAQQQYGKVYDRAAQQHNQNYQMGRDAWQLNDQQRQGTFDRNYRGASDRFNAGFRGRELSFQDMYQRWRDTLNTNTQLALAD